MRKAISSFLGSAVCVCLAAALLPLCTQAQSLEDQYANYLSAKCTNMGFDRDINFDLVAGQAGPQMQAFCSGTPPVGGGTPGESATTGSPLAGGTEDAALRRRREQLRGKDAVPAEQGSYDIGTAGATSAFFGLDYHNEKHDPTRFEGGSDADALALTVGVDRRLGSKGVLGIAARYQDQSGDFAGGGDFEKRLYGATLYASWLPVDALFVDLSAGLLRGSTDTRRTVFFTRTFTFVGNPVVIESIAPATAASDPDIAEVGGEVRVGYDWAAGANTFGPRFAAVYRHTTVDSYAETGATPMTLVIEKQTQKSLRGSLGIQASRALSAANAVWVLQGNLDWLHEFQDDQRFVDARFAQDLRAAPTRFRYQTQPPDRSSITARASVSATWRRGLSGFLAVDGLFGHEYLSRYGAALGLRKEF